MLLPEREGFEPSVMLGTTTDFESVSFDLSDISPIYETKRIRTSDPQFRKLMLYPAELWSQKNGKGGIRTPGPGFSRSTP